MGVRGEDIALGLSTMGQKGASDGPVLSNSLYGRVYEPLRSKRGVWLGNEEDRVPVTIYSHTASFSANPNRRPWEIFVN